MDFVQIIIGIFIGSVGSILAGKYLFFSNRTSDLTSKYAASEAGRDELKSKNLELQKTVLNLQKEVSQLKKDKLACEEELMEYKSKDMILTNYKFNDFGFWVHESDPNNRLCEKCSTKHHWLNQE